jgi:hypothetical protein
MLTELNHSRTINRRQSLVNQSKIFQMVNPLLYFGGAKTLDKFLETLQSNFACHKHLFQRGYPDKVKYAFSFPNTRNNHPYTTQRPTENTDPFAWASDLREARNQCLENLKLFPHQLQKMSGTKYRCRNSATKAMQE